MKYTEEQKMRAIRKLARKYGKWNVIEENDHLTRGRRDREMHDAVWKVIRKFGVMNDYLLATGDIRAKKPNNQPPKGRK